LRFRGSKSRNFKIQKIKTPQFPNRERKVGPAFQGFGVRDFVTSSTQQQHIQTSEMRKRKGEICISGFWGSELREFRCPNINIYKLMKCKKGKVRPAFWDFGVRNFVSSDVQTSTYTNFRDAKKGKGETHILGF
jgi:hypothetical protein